MEIRIKKSDIESRSNSQVARIVIEGDGEEAIFFVCAGLSSCRPIVEVSNLPKSINSKVIRKRVCGSFRKCSK